MTEGGDAAEQVVRMMLSGGEVTVRLTGSALKNIAAMLLALAKDHKKLSGKTSMIKMLKTTRDIRSFPMTREQYASFRRNAKKRGILYSAITDKRNKTALVDVILPVTEIDRANVIFEQIRYAPEHQEPVREREEREQKKERRSEPSSHDTRDNSSTKSEKSRTMSERPSVEQKLKNNKAAQEQKRQQAPTRQRGKAKNKTKGKSK